MRKSITKYNRVTFALFVLPAFSLLIYFALTPIISSFYYSFTDWNGISKKYNFIGFANYIKMFKDVRLGNALSFTLTYTIISVLVTVILSLINALALTSGIRFQNTWRAVSFFPALLSIITIGMIWNEIFYRAVPQLGNYLNIVALQTNMLGNPKLAKYAILIASTWQGTAIPTTLFIAGIQAIPSELKEAATIDGANAFQRFVHITVPFLIPVLGAVLVIVMKAGITVFDIIRVLTDGGPGRYTESIALLIYRNAYTDHKFAFGVTQSIVLFVLIASLSAIQLMFLNRKGVDEQ